MKIIQINKDHYVIVDNSEIKEGDWIIDIKDPLSPRQIKTKHLLEDLFDSEKKITHSTKPLEDGTTIHGIEHKRWVHIKYIGLSEVKELFSEINVKKKYTEEDINKIRQILVEGAITNMSCSSAVVELDKYIQSLQPKTEWEVELIDGKLKLKC
jgi:hypothetical protein